MNTRPTSVSTGKFQDDYPFNERQAESTRVRIKYPEHIPVIVEKIARSTIPVLKNKKYLIPVNCTVGEFIYLIRKKMKEDSVELLPEQAFFLFVKGTIPSTAAKLNEVYHNHKDKDGFLYINYSSENTFGKEDNSLKSSLTSTLFQSEIR